jgi:xanthine dehydrogenase accessory factor
VAGARAADEPAALATLLEGERAGAKMAILGERVIGGLGVTELLDRSVERDGRGQLDEGISRIRRYGAGGEVMGSDLAVYIQAFSTQPRMVIFGAIDFSAEMAKVASEIGYAVTICDAREPFANSPRFARAAEVVVDWPDSYLEGQELGSRDVVLVFTHDSKFDEPALIAALATGAGYVGALGSRRTQSRRVDRLRDAGLDERSIARIHAPCGLDVGARTPPETVISILAEVIAVRTGRAGESLRETSGPIHPQVVTEASGTT